MCDVLAIKKTTRSIDKTGGNSNLRYYLARVSPLAEYLSKADLSYPFFSAITKMCEQILSINAYILHEHLNNVKFLQDIKVTV